MVRLKLKNNNDNNNVNGKNRIWYFFPIVL